MAQLIKPGLHDPYILEAICYDTDNKLQRNGTDKNFLVAVEKDTWVFPWKPVCVYTGIDIRIPKHTLALVTGCPWALEDKICVHPQIISDNSPLYLIVSKTGILPRKLKKGTLIGVLTVFTANECELVQYNKDSLD